MAAAADLPALLPDDVLADVLRRLAPRHLAASRSVCKAWRAAVDAHGILRKAKEPLPLSLAGILVNFYASYFRHITELFSRPSTTSTATGTTRPSITGKHDYLPQDQDKDSSQRRHSWSSVRDHYNGLLLLDDCVLNPTTGWLAPLPPRPSLPEEMHGYLDGYLAYDPTISLDYEVILVPRFSYTCKPGGYLYDSTRDEVDPAIEQSEWPPARCVLHVFSSRTGSWEEVFRSRR